MRKINIILIWRYGPLAHMTSAGLSDKGSVTNIVRSSFATSCMSSFRRL